MRWEGELLGTHFSLGARTFTLGGWVAYEPPGWTPPPKKGGGKIWGVGDWKGRGALPSGEVHQVKP